MLVPMADITIATGRQRFNLSNVEALNLLSHIRRDGGNGKSEAERPLLSAIDEDDGVEVKWSTRGNKPH
jgi:hypothetical protein